MVAGLAYVEAPAVTPLPFGLLSAASVIDAGDGHWQMGAQYEPDYCGPAFTTEAACGPEAEDKEPTDDWTVGEFSPFAVYLLSRCGSVGGWDRAEERARRGLTLGEGRAVESRVAYLLANDPASVLLPGGPLDPATALAYLEEQAAIRYGGVPVIHASRGYASLLGDLLTPTSGNGRLTTRQASVVASYSLAGTDMAGPGGEAGPVMWATGPVTIRRGDVTVSGPVLGAGTNGPVNQIKTLAERPYAVAWECFAIAVRVTDLLAGPGGEAITGRSPVIDYPANGDTVPPVHDISGTALPPGTSVDLWTQNVTTGGGFAKRATTTSDASGHFVFSGTQATGSPGDTARFQVRDIYGDSAQVYVTVQDGA